MAVPTSEYIPDSWSCSLSSGQLIESPVCSSGSQAEEASVHIAILVAGLCRSDVKELLGERHSLSTFGHEIVGRIDRANGIDSLPVGTRVILDPLIPVARSTGFATHMVVHGPAELVSKALIPVPSNAPVDRLVFVEPLACAVHAANRLERFLAAIDRGAPEPVVVLGAGLFGVLIACTLRKRGYPVTLSNRTAARFSALSSVLTRESIACNVFDDLDHGRFGAAIVASIAVDTAILEIAAHCIRERGLIHLFAGTQPGDSFGIPPVDLDHIRRREQLARTTFDQKALYLSGSHGATFEDFLFARKMLTDPINPLLLEELVTGRIPLPALAASLPKIAQTGWSGRILIDPVLPSSHAQSDGTHLSVARVDGRVRLRRTTTPTSKAGLLLAPLHVGICGTDRQLLDGSRPDTASIQGHEAVCRIVQSDGAISSSLGMKLGDLVIINPVDPVSPDSVIGHSTDGAFQQRMFVTERQLQRGAVVPCPQRHELLGALAEPVAAAVYGLEIIDHLVGIPSRLAILGSGPIAVLFALLAANSGRTAVTLVSGNEERLGLIASTGVLDPKALVHLTATPDKASHLRDSFDVVFNCGVRRQTASLLETGAALLRPGGVLSLVAGIDPGRTPSPFDPLELTRTRARNVCGIGQTPAAAEVMLESGKRIRATGQRGTSAKHFMLALAAIDRSPDTLRKLITDIIGLSEAAWLLNLWAEGKSDSGANRRLKVVVDMTAN